MGEGFQGGKKKTFPGGRRIRILPGQYYDAETGLHYNWHRYYDPKTGRYLTADPMGIMDNEINIYVYAINNPIVLTDIFGLKVWKCSKPAATLYGFMSHQWLRTDTKEAGLGRRGDKHYGEDDEIPGDESHSDYPYISDTAIIPHEGVHNQVGSECEVVECVDENCVNNELIYYKLLGKWTYSNNCWTFVRDVLEKCRTCCKEE